MGIAGDVTLVGSVTTTGETSAMTVTAPTTATNAYYGLITASAAWTAGNMVAVRGKVTLSGSNNYVSATGGWFGLDFSTKSGSGSGLTCAINAEVTSNNAVVPNAIVYLQSLPAGSSADFSNVPFIAFTEYASAGTGTNYLFSLGHQPAGANRNVTSGDGKLFDTTTLKIEVNGNDRFIPLSTVKNAITTAAIISTSNATEATDTSTAALVVTGGIACGGDVYLGDDVFLTAAASINFNAGNATITHATDTLTVTAATIDLTGSTKIDLDGATDVTGALRIDSNTIANGAAFTVGTSGSPLSYSAATASSSGIQVHLTTDFAGAGQTSMKGADIRIAGTGGTIGSLLGIQTVVVRSSGDALTRSMWGVNGILQLTGGQSASVYGLVGDITVATGTKVGTDGSASYLTAGLFRTDVNSACDFADVGITAPVIAVLVGNDDNGATKLKADGCVVAVIGGDTATATGGAAFKVIRLNSISASEFDYGLDLYSAATGYKVNDFMVADIRLSGGATFANVPDTDILTITEGTIVLTGAITAGGTLSSAYPVVLTYAGEALNVTATTTTKLVKIGATIAAPNMGDGYGLFEIDTTLSGTAVGHMAASSCWVNLGASADLSGTGGSFVAVHNDGIYEPAGADPTGAVLIFGSRVQAILGDASGWSKLCPWSINTNDRACTAMFEVASPTAYLGMTTGTHSSAVTGSVPFMVDSNNKVWYIRVHDTAS